MFDDRRLAVFLGVEFAAFDRAEDARSCAARRDGRQSRRIGDRRRARILSDSDDEQLRLVADRFGARCG